jgi:hypothetical protein
LEAKINDLKGNVKSEKIKNLIFMWLAVVFILIAWFFLVK